MPLIGLVVSGQEMALARWFLETLIIAGIVLYGTVRVLNSQMGDITTQITRVVAQEQRTDRHMESLDRRVTRNEVRLSDLRRIK